MTHPRYAADLCSAATLTSPELWLVVQMTDTGQLSRARVAGATRGSGILPDILPDLSPLQKHCNSNQTAEQQMNVMRTFGQTGHSCEWNRKARNKGVWLPLFERN